MKTIDSPKYRQDLHSHINLDHSQGLALERVLQGFNVFVSGPAGCGKSLLIGALRSKFKGNAALCASSALAARNVCGVTIHRLFQLPAEPYIEPTFIPALAASKRQALEALELLIIDEVGTVRSDILAAIDRILRFCASGDNKCRPFGGKQIVVLGDLGQLPPVVPFLAGVHYKLKKDFGGWYVFNTKCWREAEFLPVALGNAHRQRFDPEFSELLGTMRLYDCENYMAVPRLEELIARLNRRFQLSCPLDERPCLCATNAEAGRINDRLNKALGTEPTLFDAETNGNVGRRGLPAPWRLELREGSRIMVTANSYDQTGLPRHFNGDQGIVVDILDDEPPLVRVRLDDGREIDVGPHRWPIHDCHLRRHPYLDGEMELVQYEVGAYSQLPLRLGWAMTVHRAQGQTIPRCHIRLGERGFRQSGQAYVALSRAPAAESISLDRPLSLGDVRTSQDTVRFIRFIEDEAES